MKNLLFLTMTAFFLFSSSSFALSDEKLKACLDNDVDYQKAFTEYNVSNKVYFGWMLDSFLVQAIEKNMSEQMKKATDCKDATEKLSELNSYLAEILKALEKATKMTIDEFLN